MLCQSVIWAGFGLPVSESGTLAERLLWPWATEQSARPQSGILSSFAHMLCSTHPSKSRLSLGRQHIACYVVWAALLSAVALRTLYFKHFKLFYFTNVIGLVQRIVRFVCVPNRKPRTERFNTNTRIVTPLIYIYCIYIYIYTYIHTHIHNYILNIYIYKKYILCLAKVFIPLHFFHILLCCCLFALC